MSRVSKPSAADAPEALLEAGRTQPVLSYDVELGLARHHHWLRSDAPLPDWASASAGTAATSLTSVAIKTLFSIVLLGALGVAAWHWRDRPPSSAAAVEQRSAAPERPAAIAPSTPDVPATDAWLATTPIPVPDQNPPSGQPIVGHGHKRAQRSQRAHKELRAVPAASTAAVPAVEPVHAAPDRVKSGAPAVTTAREVASAEREPSLAPKARPESAPRAQEPDDLAEMQQVAAAEQLLERSPDRALALVRQGDRRFASGYFQQERAYIAIMALIRLGRIEEARAGAARFAQQFPALPYGVRIRNALAAQQAP